MDPLTLFLLGVILLLALILPIWHARIEHNLEFFLLVMGVSAVSVTHQWSPHLTGEALKEPLPITAAVLVFGLGFQAARNILRKKLEALVRAVGRPAFAFLVVAGLGLLSSLITAIIAALVLVEIVSTLQLNRKSEIRLVVLACFSIGLGAALTPLGEPLSTIVIGKLRGEPYHADFWFLSRLLGSHVMVWIAVLSGLAAFIHPRDEIHGSLSQEKSESLGDILMRTGRVYVFVAALVLLGTGFQPAIDRYVLPLPSAGLYWINTISAVLDNATLAAAEISPKMAEGQMTSALMSLLIAGGMLIPGNIPNIIAAHKLKITSREWAAHGAPLGGAMLLGCFIWMFVWPGG